MIVFFLITKKKGTKRWRENPWIYICGQMLRLDNISQRFIEPSAHFKIGKRLQTVVQATRHTA